ncbi:MAG TPA: EthD family reductase [Chloroflexota bacterium]|nr:EthD family reductase [Chloroflexota bacterium]
MVKLTAIYGHPTDPTAFETYYAEIHAPIAMKMPYVKRLDLAKAIASPGQDQPAIYRTADIWFDNLEQCHACLASPEGVATGEDLAKFATGGVTLTISEVVTIQAE